MQAICPRNNAHKRFATTAHVLELWEVTPSGDWVSTIEQLSTSFSPDPGNLWDCLDCADEGHDVQAEVS
jgi:hypothetical protein